MEASPNSSESECNRRGACGSHSFSGVDRRAATVSFALPPPWRSPVTVHQNIGPSYVDATARWVWDTAPVMCEFLIDHAKRLLAGRSVVEVGAGTGLPGLVSARLGPSSVVLTDLPSELELLEKNVEVNVAQGKEADVTVRACAWGELDEWQGEVFDTVLCSDVLYHQPRNILKALANTLEVLCSKRSGVVVFAYHFRENLIHDAQFFEFIDELFDERARFDFGDVWMFEWVPKRGEAC